MKQTILNTDQIKTTLTEISAELNLKLDLSEKEWQNRSTASSDYTGMMNAWLVGYLQGALQDAIIEIDELQKAIKK